MPSQSYYFDFRVSGRGPVTCEMRCALTGREANARVENVEAAEFSALLKKLLNSRVLELVPEPPRFLPDTVVGCLEISDGETTFRAYFAADPGQVNPQTKAPPPELLRAVDAVYAAASRLTGKRALKP